MFFGGGFPFGGMEDDEDFPGMGGGMPGGMPGGRREKKEIDNKKLYDILGCDKDATFDQIKKAYRKLAIKNHPDKGGDQEKFTAIQNAYDILGDKDKRELYDQHGEEGVKQGGGPGGGMGDIFDMFMGGRGGGAAQKQKVRVKPMVKKVQVSLADIYNGKDIEVEVERQRVCDTCNGIGGTDATAVQKCPGCKGRGQKTTMRQMGPGMYTQSTGPCDDCHGQGEMINLEKRCKTCKGKKVKRDRKKIKVEMDKGSPNGEQFTVHGEGDQVPDVEAGDVIVVIEIRPSKIFKRKGADLYIEKEISLLDALTGTSFSIIHLDGRAVKIQNKAGEIIKPESTMTCEGLGLPFHKSPYKFGNLFITFKVVFPDQMSTAQIESINQLLSNQRKSAAEIKSLDEADEEVKLIKFQEHHRNTQATGGKHQQVDSDEEGEDDGQGGQGVGCQQQ